MGPFHVTQPLFIFHFEHRTIVTVTLYDNILINVSLKEEFDGFYKREHYFLFHLFLRKRR